ncbi:hypothetical protein [Candidatus Similichlamydia laticola]|uniref:hypothetical protein n=1 Tax=Candidatus Similichlamydia laticola TaxID=2170265 RepID=UPI000DF7EB40|nr:hypothetical protein [Candidatus Similichlamydia laticola]
MKPTSRLNILFLIFSLGMTPLHGLPIQDHQTCAVLTEAFSLREGDLCPQILNREEMTRVTGSKLSWPFDSAGPLTVVVEALSVIGFGIYKSITNATRKKEIRERKDVLKSQRDELAREVKALEQQTENQRRIKGAN